MGGFLLVFDYFNGLIRWFCEFYGSFEFIKLIEGIFWVVDVCVVDFDKDGNEDVFIVEFGWYCIGCILFCLGIGEENGVLKFVEMIVD